MDRVEGEGEETEGKGLHARHEEGGCACEVGENAQ